MEVRVSGWGRGSEDGYVRSRGEISVWLMMK